MTDPTPVDAERLRELLAEASPLPWRAHDTWLDVGGYTATVIRNDRTRSRWAVAWFPSWSGEPGDLYRNELHAWQDAQFTAAAVNALPSLLDEVEALRSERDRLRVESRQYEAAINDAHEALTVAGCPLGPDEATVDGRIYALHPDAIDRVTHLPKGER